MRKASCVLLTGLLLLAGCGTQPANTTSTAAQTTKATVEQTTAAETTKATEAETTAEAKEPIAPVTVKSPQELGLQDLELPISGLYVHMPYDEAVKALEKDGIPLADCTEEKYDGANTLQLISGPKTVGFSLQWEGEKEYAGLKTIGVRVYFLPSAKALAEETDFSSYTIKDCYLYSVEIVYPENTEEAATALSKAYDTFWTSSMKAISEGSDVTVAWGSPQTYEDLTEAQKATYEAWQKETNMGGYESDSPLISYELAGDLVGWTPEANCGIISSNDTAMAYYSLIEGLSQ